MRLDDIKQQIEHRDALKWVQTQLKRFSTSNVKRLDIDIKSFDSPYGKSTTPLYFDRFDEEFIKEWLKYNEKFFNDKLHTVNAKLNKIEDRLS